MNTYTQPRAGYTLIELLVVIALVAVLASITVAFLPSQAASAAEARAAAQLQGWLNIAKQRALRDQAPRGLRLWPSAANPLQCVECQYIEQPDDYNGASLPPTSAGTGGWITSNPAGTVINFNPAGMTNDLFNGDTTGTVNLWNVQPGDSLEVLGSGLMHPITAVGQYAIQITPALPYPINTPTPNYRIIRAPRPVGDETLKLPDGTIIDGQTNLPPPLGFNSPLPVVYVPGTNPPVPVAVDILFSPSGAVISQGVTTANLNLWVRAPDPNDGVNGLNPFRGQPSIVSVFVRTGLVGYYPPTQQGSPYSLVY